jgi:uncharacterized protein (DUF58 family)
LTAQQLLTARIIVLLIFIGTLGIIAGSAIGLLAVALVATVGVIGYATRRVLVKRIRYWRKLEPERVFEGETLVLWRNVQNDSRLPAVHIHVDDSAPKHFELLAETQRDSTVEKLSPQALWVESTTAGNRDLTQLLALLPRQRISRGVQMKAQRRGFYRFDPFYLRVSDVLGLSGETLTLENNDAIIVYPRTFPIASIPLQCREPFGALPALRSLVEDPLRIVGARDYAYGDSFRQIDWKSTARRNRLQTRVYERASEPSLTIVLNVATFQRYWEGIETSLFECAVSLAASFATWAHAQGWAVGLSSNGNAPQIAQMPRVRARRSPKQLARVLESLAAIGPYFFLPLEEFAFAEQRFLPRTSTQLIITPIMNAAIEDALRRLAAQGKRLAVLCAGCTAPEINGVVSVNANIEAIATYFRNRHAEQPALAISD